MEEWEREIHDRIPAECKHGPPRSKVGNLGMVDTCPCGLRKYVLRYAGDAPKKKRWDRWSG